jgi:HlyD family secretion protein
MAGGGGSAQSGDASSLTVSKVCVSVGQQIQEGDALYEVEDDSVAELTEELETNVEKAKADLDAVYADQVLSKQTAQYTYDSSTAYGSYAQTEYNTTITQLQQTVTDKEKELQRANESLEDYKQQLEEITAAYNDAEALADSVEWGAEHTDKSDDVYNYVQRFQQAQTAKQTLENLEQKKDRLEQNVEQAQTNVEQSQKNLNEAKRNLAQGLLSASQTLSLRQLAYDTAQETYDIALAYLEDEVTEQEETYADAAEKWEEYSSYIDGNTIRSQYSGVITGIDLDEGDLIQTGSVLVTLYDMDDVTMTVTLYEEDMTDIALGSAANIVFTAYPDEVFQATVTEISDATTTSSGYVTYDVTVTLEGDVSGLFQGMTGDITFITEQTQDVLYVSRRALVTEGDDTYVKVRGSNGKVQKVKVTTGFTDGVYTEITEGLSEGDVVLIESKTSK